MNAFAHLAAAVVSFAALAIPGIAFGMEPVFGLPLGGKFPKTQNCRWPDLTKQSTPMCWLDRPRVFSGSLTGHLHVPDSPKLPAWATFRHFEVWISPSGILESIKLSGTPSDDAATAAGSITARFGAPQSLDFRNPSQKHATWLTDEVDIEFLCGEVCYITFRTIESSREIAKGRALQQAQDAARSRTP